MKCAICEVERGKTAEKKLNEWLKTKDQLNVQFITQAIKGSLLITTIFYK